MSDAEQKIPYMFRGSSRVYRVIGVQDSTFFGLNVGLLQGTKPVLELVFACLGTPPEDTPFKARGGTTFVVAFDPKPQGDLPVVQGTYLNKLQFPLGKNLTGFQTSQYLHSLVPQIQQWLDKLLEDAHIVPAYNDVADIFTTFFGQEVDDSETFPLELPNLIETTGVPLTVDFSKYGKGDTAQWKPESPAGEPGDPAGDEGEDDEDDKA